MSSKAIGTSPCPKCRERGGDSRGNNLVNYSDGGGHCFACGYHIHAKRLHAVIEEPKHVSALLPNDFSRDIPAVAWKWLLQYGMPMSYWKKYVGFSKKYSRLVFTVGDPTVFSIGRYIETEDGGETSLRQLGEFSVVGTRAPGKWFVWGDSHKTAVCLGDVSTSTCVVLAEDIISSHKLGGVVCSIPLFGTVAHACHLQLCKYLGLPIVLWLDKDQQGITYKKANHISMLTGLSCTVVHTDKDPKELTFNQIKEQLNA